MYKFTPILPEVSRDPADLDHLVGQSLLGNDLEWSQLEQPTVLGISDGVRTVSVPFEDGVDQFKEILRRYPETEWVGHNIVAADLIVLERMGIRIPLNRIQDTIIWMWLVNMHLAKASGKTALEEDEGEKRGRGFYNLGTMLSIYTDIWHYKDCRGSGCNGPCPEHDKYGYNGIDSLGPVLALPALRRQAQLRRVDHLYEMHRELAYVLAQMQDYGVFVDVPYIKELDVQFARDRQQIEESLPFNPKSPKAVVAHFKALGLKNAQEATVKALVDDLEDAAPTELVQLLEYKELGNGTDRWFQEQYRDKNGWLKGYRDANGFVHPRLNFFTSSARLACSSPNFQNVYKRKGEHIRRAIVAPLGWYIVRADYSNAENRYVLHRGGYSIPRDMDLHTWVGEMAGLTSDMELVRRTGGGKIRQAAKSIQHANNILEGLQLKRLEDLRKPKIRSEIAAGARVVYPNWMFRGKVVTFTGVNLARRTYGDATWPHRKDALEISARYFDRFPGVRKFQQEVSKQCEIEGAVRTPLGYCLVPETLILTTELRWKRLGDLTAADELIGFDETIKGTGQKRRFHNAKVEHLQWLLQPCYRIVTTYGDVIASKKHYWLVKTKMNSNNIFWRPTEQIKVGQSLCFMAEPWGEDNSREAGYLAGVYDGEGSVRRQQVVFCQNPNVVLDRVQELLRQKNFSFGLYNKASQKIHRLYFTGGLATDLRFLGQIRPHRLYANADKLWNGSHWVCTDKAEILAIEYVGPRWTVGAQTSTKTFIANGLLSHNCLLSFGDDEDRMKIAQGVQQQLPVAHLTKLALLRLWKRWKDEGLMRPFLQCHDEILTYVKDSVPPEVAMEWLQEAMEIEMPEIPELIIPADTTFGPTWAESDQKSFVDSSINI